MYELKEVYYFCYCHKCKYEKLNERCEPCNTCLTIFMNQHSHKPVNFEPKEEMTNVRRRNRRDDEKTDRHA